MRQTISAIRAKISRGEMITNDEVLTLCAQGESVLSVSLRLERALHDAIKTIEAAAKE